MRRPYACPAGAGNADSMAWHGMGWIEGFYLFNCRFLLLVICYGVGMEYGGFALAWRFLGGFALDFYSATQQLGYFTGYGYSAMEGWSLIPYTDTVYGTRSTTMYSFSRTHSIPEESRRKKRKNRGFLLDLWVGEQVRVLCGGVRVWRGLRHFVMEREMGVLFCFGGYRIHTKIVCVWVESCTP